MQTEAPLCKRRSTMALPMPFAPPVTSADFPAKSYAFGIRASDVEGVETALPKTTAAVQARAAKAYRRSSGRPRRIRLLLPWSRHRVHGYAAAPPRPKRVGRFDP